MTLSYVDNAMNDYCSADSKHNADDKNHKPLSPRKKTIARHFSHAADYEQHANIQRQICQHLIARVAQPQQQRVLEVGAGTGQLTALLAAHIHSDDWDINELSSSQAATLQSLLPTATILIGDAETMDLADHYSLIMSANAVQWFDNPLNFIAQSMARLDTGGQLLFNTFTPDNFLQIKTLTDQGLYYPDTAEWHKALVEVGFKNIELKTERFELLFSRPYEVLKHMKLTGVSTNLAQVNAAHSQPFVWTKSRLQQFESDYWQRFAVKNDQDQPQVALTYEALIISAFKP